MDDMPSDDAHLYDDNDEHNEALRAEIDAKKAEIIHGFPLPGLAGVAQVASHLSSLPALQFSNFPYASSTPESTTFANIPEFQEYAPAMDALFKATMNADGSVKPEDEAMFKSAAAAMNLAVRSDTSGIESIVWNDYPYALPSVPASTGPYTLARPKKIKRSNATNISSLSEKVLNDASFPYPPPVPAADSDAFVPALPPLPPTLSAVAGPSNALTNEEVQAAAEAKAFFNTYLDQCLPPADPDQKPNIRNATSPIPFLASSSRPNTPAKPTFQASSSNLQQQVPPSNIFSPLQNRHHLLSPQASSSPDPLAIGGPSRITAGIPKSRSMPVLYPVVEIPHPSAKKRGRSETESLPASKKQIISNGVGKSVSTHGPFSEPPTSEMEVDAGEDVDVKEEEEDDTEVLAEASSPVVVTSRAKVKQKERSSALKIVINKPSTPSRSHTLQSTSKTDEVALEKFTDYIQDIVDAEHALLATLGMHIDGEGDEEQDEARDRMIAQYFYIPEEGGRYATLQPGTIAKLLRLLNPCIKSPNGRRLLEEAMFQEPEASQSQSRGSSKKRAGKERQREREESDLVAQLQSVLKLLERSAAQVEVMKIVPGDLAELGGKSDGYVSPVKKQIAKKGTKAKANGEKASKSPSVSSSPVKPRRSSRSATPSQDYEEEELEDEDEKEDEDEQDEESMSSPVKGKGGRKGKKGSATPTQKTAAKGKKKQADNVEDEAKAWSGATVEQFFENLETFGDGLHAIEAALSILTAGKLPKKLYSEDLVNSCLNTLKKQLPLAIYPALDADNSAMSIPLSDKRVNKLIKAILQKVPIIFTLITSLLKQEELPEAIIINGVYLAIAPFFVEQGLKSKAKDAGFGVSETKVIRNEALAMIKLIFSKYTNQRQWILEEVLSSITKLPDIGKRKPQYLLSNGQYIQTVSVLLFHLVQSGCAGVYDQVQAARRQYRNTDGEAVEGDMDEIALIRDIVEPALESTNRSGKGIVSYLLHRSGKAPKNSTASEAEYKAVLDHLVRDVLIVLNLPEWPVASLLVWQLASSMMKQLANNSTAADANAAKSVSLDHLGSIAVRIYKITNAERPAENEEAVHLRSLPQIVDEQTRSGLRALAEAEQEVEEGLMSVFSEGNNVSTAFDYSIAQWSNELAQASKRLQAQQKKEDIKPKFEIKLWELQTSLWDIRPPVAQFTSDDSERRSELQKGIDKLFTTRGLPACKQPLLEHILQASDGAVINFRQKALKALATIVEEDSSIFFQEKVQQAIENRLKDKSPAVRDAAVELLGRYVVYDGNLANRYLPEIRGRIKDSGLSVRKRVIKLLKAIYPVVVSEAKVDICKSLLTRMNDEDDNVKEMAISALSELWFGTKAAARERELSPAKAATILADTAVLQAVVSSSSQTPHPVESLLLAALGKSESKSANRDPTVILSSIKQMIEVLVDALTDPQKRTEMNVASCIKLVQVLLTVDPSMLKINRATLLLPELKSATTPEEKIIQENLLRIFTSFLGNIDSSASTFARGLQQSCTVLLNKPTLLSEKALQEVVACFCVVTITNTNDYSILCRVFQKYLGLLRQGIGRLLNKEKPPTPAERAIAFRDLPVLARTVSLFCQYGEFDRLRACSPDASLLLNAISTDSIQQHVYDQMMDLYYLSLRTPLNVIALECLGYLYRSTPQNLEDERSAKLVHGIFESGTTKAKATVLQIICDLLAAQASKFNIDGKSEEPQTVDIKQLVGNNEQFADSSISTSITQRYLHYILQAALTPIDAEGGRADKQILLRPALQAISFTVKQGLANPMQSLPILIALETSDDALVAKKAFTMHSSLHSKHSALVNMRMSDSIKKAFHYQVALSSREDVRGYRGEPPVALLHYWYSLMREKRQWRLDCLKALLRGLQVEIASERPCTQDDVDFARFTAENAGALEYKSQEEVFFIIRTLTDFLSVSGMQVYHQLRMDDDQEEAQPEVGERDEPDAYAAKEAVLNINLCRKSIVLAIVFCLRLHVKTVYGVTDQKMSKYVLGKKSAAGDKPVHARSGASLVIQFPGMPFTVDMLQEQDVETQRQAFIKLIDSDDSIREREDDQEDENMSS